jgi:hypothetical protein
VSSDPVRIFVGCAPNNDDLESQSVLEWSLRKHASAPLEIEWMKLTRDPASFWYSDPGKGAGWRTAGWATPFSCFRWAVPERCGFAGRGIYTDSDMIAMDDIAKLWNQPIPDGAFCLYKGASQRFCVTLFDCARAREYLKPVSYLRANPGAHREMRRLFDGNLRLAAPFEGNWNCLDGERYESVRDPEVKMIHYTSIPQQVQLRHAIPRLAASGQTHWAVKSGHHVRDHERKDLRELFDELLAEARENGYGIERYRDETLHGDDGRGVRRAA